MYHMDMDLRISIDKSALKSANPLDLYKLFLVEDMSRLQLFSQTHDLSINTKMHFQLL